MPETFAHRLDWLHPLCDNGGPFRVAFDCHSAHREEAMRVYAEELGIHLLFIQPGRTNEWQPLDRSVFGAMKGVCRRVYELYCRSDPFFSVTKKLAAAFLIRTDKNARKARKKLVDDWTARRRITH
jgi:hypothetical protein